MFLLEKMISLIAPHACLVCKAEGSVLCMWCRPDACLLLPPRCYKCQKHSVDSAVCKNCRRKTKLRYVWVATEYRDVAKRLIHTLKFEHTRQAAEIIAEYLDESVPYLDEQALVVHIPTASKRIRQRGYDQAELIARFFSSKRGIKYANVLKRSGQSRQVGAKRQQRHEQLQHAFWVSRKKTIENRTIILIDDVSTTGSTIEAAAKAMKDNGAGSVYGVVFAQVK